MTKKKERDVPQYAQRFPNPSLNGMPSTSIQGSLVGNTREKCPHYMEPKGPGVDFDKPAFISSKTKGK